MEGGEEDENEEKGKESEKMPAVIAKEIEWHKVRELWNLDGNTSLVSYDKRDWEATKHNLVELLPKLINVVYLTSSVRASFPFMQLPSLCSVELEFQSMSKESSVLRQFLDTAFFPCLTRLDVKCSKGQKLPDTEWFIFLDNMKGLPDSNVRELILWIPYVDWLAVPCYPIFLPFLKKLKAIQYNAFGENLSLFNQYDMPELTTLDVFNVHLPERMKFTIFAVRNLLDLYVHFNLKNEQRQDHERLMRFTVEMMDHVLRCGSKPKWLFAHLSLFDMLDSCIHREPFGMWRFYSMLRKEWDQLLFFNKYVYYRQLSSMLQTQAKRCNKILGDGITSLANHQIFPFMKLYPAVHFKPVQKNPPRKLKKKRKR